MIHINKNKNQVKTGGLGDNPLNGIDPQGLEGLIGRSDGSKFSDLFCNLIYTKSVKLSQEDFDFVQDMAIAVRKEGNFSEGIRTCIKAARKHYGDEVEKLAAQRKEQSEIKI